MKSHALLKSTANKGKQLKQHIFFIDIEHNQLANILLHIHRERYTGRPLFYNTPFLAATNNKFIAGLGSVVQCGSYCP